MKKIMLSIVIALLLSTMFVPAAFGRTFGPTIYFGQDLIGGYMRVTPNADGSITLVYMMKGSAGWCMTESAVHVGRSLDDFPTNPSGMTIPGHFDFKVYGPDSPCITRLEVTLHPYADQWSYGEHIYMAIHVVGDNPQLGLYEETGWSVRCGVKAEHYFNYDMWAGGLWLEIVEEDWEV